MAVRVVNETLGFLNPRVVDYEALTAGLPADYNADGEHWGCPPSRWMWREKTANQCKPLGNLVLANVVANTLCNGL